MAIIDKSAGHGCYLGLDWNDATVDGGTYKIQPYVYRKDASSTDNYGSTFSESLSPDANNNMGTGSWSGYGWGATSSSWKRVDSFAVRKYAKKHSSYTVTLKVYTDSEFGTWNGSWYSLGSQTFSWSITIPARTSYTVSYNNNGGSGSPSSQTKWYGESLTLSSTKPTYSGYSFKRWNTNTSDSGTAYSSGASYTGNAALSLYAIWNRTVTYNKNTTDTVGSMPSSQTGVKSSAITLSSNTPTRTGYKFYHWNTGSGNGGTTYNKGASYGANNPNVTLYAIWNPIITYKANGGSGSDQTQDKTYGTSATLKAASTFSRSGYTFKRWNTNSSDTGTGYNAGASFSGNSATTLYAIWNHTVTYNANGGSNAPAAQTAIAQTNITISSSQPTRSGHTFLGWNTKADGTGTNYSAGTSYSGGNMTLYAKWRVDIQLTNVTCSLVDSNGTADPLGKYVAVGADYDATLSGEDVQSITATMTHSNVGDSDSVTSGLGLTGHVDFMFGPYDYDDFDPHGGYLAGTLSAVNSLGEMDAALNIAETEYRSPNADSVLALRATTISTGGTREFVEDEQGTDLAIDMYWTAYSSGSQTRRALVVIEQSDGTVVATRTFSNLVASPSRLYIYADPVNFPDDVLTGGELLPVEKQFTVTVTFSDAYSDVVESAKSSRSDILTIAYFTLDFLGDVYLYSKTADETVDPNKTYYTRSGYGSEENPYVYTVVASPVDADIDTYYEANGRRPGHGMGIGVPATREALDIGMTPFVVADKDNFGALGFKSANRSGHVIKMFGSDTSKYGDALVIGDGGMTFIGGGESAINMYNQFIANGYVPENEITAVCADSTVYLISNADTPANAKRWAFTTGGNLAMTMLDVDTTKSNNGLSASTYRNFSATDAGSRYMSYIETTAYPDGSVDLKCKARNYGTGSMVNNGVTMTVANNGTRTVSFDYTKAWVDALSIDSAITGSSTASDVITASSGVTISGAAYSKWGRICTLWVNFKLTSDLSVPASGNMTDKTIGTLKEAIRPVRQTGAWTIGDNAGAAWFSVESDGTVTLCACEGTGSARTITAGSVFNMRASFMTLNP